MKRREFIALVGGMTVAWPLAGHAQQQPALPLIGFLNAQTASSFQYLLAAFQKGLSEKGFVEGQNITIEYRWAEGHFDQLPKLAADLIDRQPSVLVGTGGANLAAMAATKSIPIVATFGGDPVRQGFVASLNHPGGNVTGAVVFSSDLEAKRLELINEIAPRGTTVGYLFDPKIEMADLELSAVQTAARTIGRDVRVVEASTDADLEKAFKTFAEAHVTGLVVGSTPLFNNLRKHVLTLTEQLKVPVVYEIRQFVTAGGLMSYGTNVPEVYRQIGIYTARVLGGERPADLPLLLPVKFETVLNLKTAKSQGIDIPTSILLRADEVIE